MSFKVKAKTSWKTVKLEDGLRTRGIPEDLVGIEVLKDYTLLKKTKTGVVRKKSKLNQKTETTPSSADKSGDSEKPLGKKLKKKVKQAVTSQNGDGGPEDVNTTEIKLPKKKKKKNRGNKTKNGNSSGNNPLVPDDGDNKKTIQEPLAKQPREEAPSNDLEQEEEEEPPTLCDDNNFEITPDMIIWKAMFLPDPIVRAVWELGFHHPTAIQMAVLPTAMKGRRDVVGAAETGSGKTLAFGIPILYGIMKDKEFELKKSQQEVDSEEDEEQDGEHQEEQPQEETMETDQEEESTANVQGIGCVKVIDNIDFASIQQPMERKTKLRALIITPTRELAVQIEKHLKAVAKYTGVTIALVIGGMAAPKQERILSKGPDVVIGTPGRIWELVEGGNPHLSQVNDIRYLALDETDRLLEQGHFAELRTLLEHINKDEHRKRWRQNFVFSATLTLAHDLPNRLGNIKRRKKKEAIKLDKLLSMVGVRPKAKIVDLTAAAKAIKPATLTEMKLYSASIEDKDYYLYYFLRHHPGRTLVFCNSINNVRRLTSVFTLLEMNPLALHAQMHQKQRLKHLERFTSTDNALLIATDVAARGLDIPHVQHVVHFQVPRTSENYVHRSGRTARASRDGLSLMLIEPGETAVYRRLCATLKKDSKTDLPDFEVDMRLLSAVKLRVNLARSIELLEHRTKRERSDVNWVKKMAEEADIVLEDDYDDLDDDSGGAAQDHARLLADLRAKRKELSQLLARPLKRTVH